MIRLAMLAALAATAAAGADKQLTLYFTGDNGGELSPCGCKHNPAGGLARRKTVLDNARAKGPVLLVDAGNALFRAPGLQDEPSRARAEFLLGAMGRLDTFAMAAGARDLNAGAEFLRAAAQKAKVKVLSANLRGKDGQALFPASAIADVGGVKVGVIGVSPSGSLPGVSHLTGAPAGSAVLEEAKKLSGKVDLVLVLAALPYNDAYQLANEAESAVDVVLVSHDARPAGPAQRNAHNYVIPGGERGRQVGKLVLTLGGKGNFVDVQEMEREKQLLPLLAERLALLEKRVAATQDAEAKKLLVKELDQMKASRKAHEKVIAQGSGKNARTIRLDWVNLGPDIKGDPELEKEVAKFEPAAAGH
ncbi:MAG: 5'-nucleotidase [Myxococcota bacterium]